MITRDQALEGLTDQPADESVPKSREIADAEAARVEVDGRKQYFALRSDWSGYIACWISALIIFNSALTVGVGTGWLQFEKMQWFVT